jgi:thymidylate synthase ThyX
VKLVTQQDPEFFKHAEDPIPLEETLEHRMFQEVHGAKPAAKEFLREYDERLGDKRSVLLDWKANGEATLAQAVRTVLGATKDKIDDARAIQLVLDPSQHKILGGALNLTSHGKLARALFHVHYTFAKKLSHTADSQDQRHRMTPASRPILAAHVDLDTPDLVLPEIVEREEKARELMLRSGSETWEAMRRLVELGAAPESAHYLLPNAVAIRFEESGDLLNLHHKWSQRLCYLAQEEIWRASKEEVEQVRKVHPQIAEWIGPPCWARKRAKQTPYCPEGERFCGVPVWNLPIEKYERVI